MVKSWGTAFVLAALCWSQRGSAQEAAAPEAPAPAASAAEGCDATRPEDVEAAKQAFRDGQVAFSEGDYQHAAELWHWAYERDCSAHALLLNLATAQELLGRPDLAGKTLRQFNERAPDSPYLEANRKRIARLERVALAPVRPRRDTAAKACPPPLPTATPTSEQHGGGSGFSLPWLIVASGGAATVLGGIFYVEARYAAGQVSDACGGPDECSRVENVLEGERARARAQTAGWIAGVGLVAATGGIVWQLSSGATSSASAGSSPPLRLASALGPRQAGLTLSGGF
jgi:tetratricopeptide (TPR) repeat protein